MNDELKQKVAELNLYTSNLNKGCMLSSLVGFISGYIFENDSIPTQQKEVLANKIISLHTLYFSEKQ
jgi:hypothetical protein